ncbi:MAG TPA: hypothetical protein VFK32_02230 [Tepidiformaceae bacterium]|nr:hypothetical protein [Tepidiformaceae bacterium]
MTNALKRVCAKLTGRESETGQGLYIGGGTLLLIVIILLIIIL